MGYGTGSASGSLRDALWCSIIEQPAHALAAVDRHDGVGEEAGDADRPCSRAAAARTGSSMVSVKTSSLIGLAAILAAEPFEKTPCETQA